MVDIPPASGTCRLIGDAQCVQSGSRAPIIGFSGTQIPEIRARGWNARCRQYLLLTVRRMRKGLIRFAVVYRLESNSPQTCETV